MNSRKFSMPKKSSALPTGFTTARGKPLQVKESTLNTRKGIFEGIIDGAEVELALTLDLGKLETEDAARNIPAAAGKATPDTSSLVASHVDTPVNTCNAARNIPAAAGKTEPGTSSLVASHGNTPVNTCNAARNIPAAAGKAEPGTSFLVASHVDTPVNTCKHVGLSARKKQGRGTITESVSDKNKELFDGSFNSAKEEPNFTIDPAKISLPVPKTKGFLTAGGRHVGVTEASLKETKGKFKDTIVVATEELNSTDDLIKPEYPNQNFHLEKSRAETSTLAPKENGKQVEAVKLPRQNSNNIVGDFPDDDSDFEDCVIESPCAKPIPVASASTSSVLRRGKKLFEELAQESPSDDSLDCLEPLGKKIKVSNTSNVRVMDLNATVDDCVGAMTQEVIDSTLALLADEAESSFAQDVEMDESFAPAQQSFILSSPPESPARDSDIASRIQPNINTAREAARLAQEMRIRYTVSILIKPNPGLLWHRKNSAPHRRISLCTLTRSAPKVYSEQELAQFKLKKSILKINAENAVAFRFNVAEFYCEYVALKNGEGIFVEDDICLVLSSDSSLGAEEFANGLMASPAVDPRLISVKWVHNHYRWIVWTLANYELKFPHLFAGRALTPENVALRLKYRYDREIDKSQRSAVHRITEQDDVASKRIVLMVSGIKLGEGGEGVKERSTLNESNLLDTTSSPRNSSPNTSGARVTLELSDGWYSIPATADHNIASFVEKGTIAIGTKLILTNAELVGAEASHPLEADGKVMLKFGANSSRRAHWNTRLGYCKQASPFPLVLHSIISTGGVVPLIHAIVARQYPLIYMHKNSKGKPTFENKRTHDKNQRARELERQSKVEQIQMEVEKEIDLAHAKSKGARRQSLQTSFKREMLENMNPEDLLDLMESLGDSASFEPMLSRSKLNQIQEFRYQQMEKVHAKVRTELEKRLKDLDKTSKDPQPVPILKLRIVDARNVSVQPARSYAVVSIWRPGEDLQRMLTEGSAFQILSLLPSNTHATEIRLNSTRTTKFLPLKHADMSNYEAVRRSYYSLSEVLEDDFAPTFGEFDTVGLVVYIAPFTESVGQTVYLADADKNILGIKFWNPLTNLGLEEIIKVESFLVLSNLQWRASSPTCKIPTAFVYENTLFTLNPKDAAMEKVLGELREDLVDFKRFSVSCEMKVYSMLSGRNS